MTKMFNHFSKTLSENVGNYENIHIHYDDARSNAGNGKEILSALQEKVNELTQRMAKEHSVVKDNKGNIEGNMHKVLGFIESVQSKEEADVRNVLEKVEKIGDKVNEIMQIAKSELDKKGIKLQVLVPPNRYIIPF